MVNKVSFPILKTQRLLLRQINETDAHLLFKLRTDVLVNKYIERPQERTDTNGLEFVKRIQHGLSKNEIYHWIITMDKISTLLGSICLWNFNAEKTTAEIGYDLFPQFHGQGIMSEALEEVVEFGFDQLHLTAIEAFTHRDNKSSNKLLIKNGFELSPDRSDTNNLNNIIFLKRNHSC